MKLFKYKVAIVSPAMLGQFKNAESRNHLLTAIKQLGYDEVVEEAESAEFISQATKKLILSKEQKHRLSECCYHIHSCMKIIVFYYHSIKPPQSLRQTTVGYYSFTSDHHTHSVSLSQSFESLLDSCHLG